MNRGDSCKTFFIISLILIFVLLINLSSARMPVVGGDSDNWGTVLNNFLNVSLNDSGNLRNINLSVSNADFNNGWLNGGVSINGGNLFAQALYVYNISSLNINNLNVNGSLLPAFDNLFDLGNSSMRWRNIFSSGNIYSNGTGSNYFLGNVGIGTSNPTHTLDVNGSANITNDLFVNGINISVGNYINPIVASGNNSNGYYIKYIDGTMEEWISNFSIFVNVSLTNPNVFGSTSGTEYYGSADWTYPVAFANTPQIITSPYSNVDAVSGQAATNSSKATLFAWWRANGNITVNVRAIGKWTNTPYNTSTLSIGGGIPAGAVSAFNLAACPIGWTQVGTQNGTGIVASGNNSNGNYIEFSDGSMTEWFRTSVTSTVNVAYGNIFRDGGNTFTFPVPFATTPYVTAAPLTSTVAEVWGTVDNGLNTTTVVIYQLAHITGATGYPGYVATGRWTNTPQPSYVTCQKATQDSATSNSLWQLTGNAIQLANSSQTVNIQTNLTLGGGQIIYNSTAGSYYYNNGTSWYPFGTGTSGSSYINPIVASGNNSNGYYVEYIDGTMIEWFNNNTLLNTVSTQGSIFFNSTLMTFPVPFVSTPTISSSTISGTGITWGGTFLANTTTIIVEGISGYSSGTVYLGYMAIGKWTSTPYNASTLSIGGGIPAGAIVPFNQATCPVGWALADGTNGNPDLRGIFVRGSGTNGVLQYANSSFGNFNAIYGTYNNDSLQGHWHEAFGTLSAAGTSPGNPVINGGLTSLIQAVKGAISDGTNGNPRTGKETTPAYYATIYCVKMTQDSATSNSLLGQSGNNIFLQNLSNNVGIGTATPSGGKLNVNGSVNITNDLFVNGINISSGNYINPIVASGNNSNGYYVEYIDGTMVEWSNVLSGTTNGGSGTGKPQVYYSEATWTFPVAFSSNPTVTSPTIVTSTTAMDGASGYIPFLNTNAATGIVYGSLNVIYNFTMTATGKWTNTPYNTSTLSIGGGIPAGAISPFNLAACPIGWTQVGTQNGTGIVASGSNVNGSWIKFSDGSMTQWGASPTLTTSVVSTSTLPVPFIDSLYQMTASNYPAGSHTYCEVYKADAVTYAAWGSTGNQCQWIATGKWTNTAQPSYVTCQKATQDSATSNSIWGQSGNNIFLQNLSLNVGIGTASPTAHLHINDSGTSTSNNQLELSGPSSSTTMLHLGQFASGSYIFDNYYYNAGHTTDDATKISTGILLDTIGISFQHAPASATPTRVTDIFINSSNGNVGIGTSSPTQTLTVNGNVSVTTLGGFISVDGGGVSSPPSGLSYGMFPLTTVGLGFYSANNKYEFMGAGTPFVGIGIAPVHQLQLSTNDAALPSSTVWVSISDSKTKTVLSNFTDGLNVLMKINPIVYERNGLMGLNTTDSGVHVGVLADQLKQVYPDLVTSSNYTLTENDIQLIKEKGLSSINQFATNPISSNAKAGDKISIDEYSSNDLQYILINSIKEQQNIIISLNNTLNDQTKLLKKICSNNPDLCS